MKKGTRTWKLKYMVVIHILAVIGTTGIVIYIGRWYPGVWNWFILISLTLLNYKLIQNMYKYIDRIKERKNRIY